MAVFYSFHYDKDNWRVQQIRNIGIVENTGAIAAQEWEEVRYNTDAAIRNWINNQMAYKRAVVVLIGSQTASRRWVQYEIQRAWDLKKPLLGIRIHGLKDCFGRISSSGDNPFDQFDYRQVPVFDPAGYDSTTKYADIRRNLTTWVTQGYRRP
ncbi:TIR domain-containing protein [Trueperella pyogenes]|uniref:TIR domain-containing protein n=1 Tax=Trueperella pyogenes TaxID=1661 RepID=A0ABV3NE07_9ACTO